MSHEWNPPFRKLCLRTRFANDEGSQSLTQSNQGETSVSEDRNQPQRNERRFPMDEGILRLFTVQEANAVAERRQESSKQLTRLKNQYIQKRQILPDSVQKGVNIHQLSKKDMNKHKNSISELFKTDINPLLEQLIPKADN
jgi:hypothetical protein